MLKKKLTKKKQNPQKNGLKRNLKKDLKENPFDWCDDLTWYKLPEKLRENANLERGFEYYFNTPNYTKEDFISALSLSQSQYYAFRVDLLDFYNEGLLYKGVSAEAHKELQKYKSGKRGVDHGTLKAITACSMAKFNDSQIVQLLGISPSCWSNWKKSPQIMKAISEGTVGATARVIDSLYRKAVGGYCKKEKVVAYMGQHEVVTIKEDIAGDVQAQKLWLMNHTNWQTQEKASSVDVDEIETEYDVREGFYHAD